MEQPLNQTATAPDNADLNNPESGNKQQETPVEKTYTEEQFQKMVSSQYAAGMSAAMKEAGFEPDKGEDFKKQINAFKEWQESQKTEAQRQQEEKDKIANELNAEKAEKAMLQMQLKAFAKGVPADKADKYIKLAEAYITEDIAFEDALDAAIKDFPINSKEKPLSIGTKTGGSQTITPNNIMNNLLRGR